MVFAVLLVGQSKSPEAPLIIVADIQKTNYYLGDTIRFTVKNRTQVDRGYTIEALSKKPAGLRGRPVIP
jgi:hypothetical protein